MASIDFRKIQAIKNDCAPHLFQSKSLFSVSDHGEAHSSSILNCMHLKLVYTVRLMYFSMRIGHEIGIVSLLNEANYSVPSQNLYFHSQH